MLSKPLVIAAAALIAVAASGGALADGNAKKGKRVFNKCKTCHELAREKNKIGPHLVGILGRKAGSVAGFKYSSAMKGSGIVWDKKTLDTYITNPKKFVPGNKMVFPGLKKESQREDVIAYIAQESAKK